MKHVTHLHKDSSRRSGFTLVELLVVVAIIAVLAALLAAATLRMLTVPPEIATKTTIQKLGQTLNQQWKAVIDQARNEGVSATAAGAIPPAIWQALLQQAGGDNSAAQDLWVQLRLQQEFPQTFAQALQPPGGLPPKPVFAVLQGQQIPTNSVHNQERQTAVLLYLIVTAARRGMNFDPEANLTVKEKATVNGFTYITDGWGEPIHFSNLDPSDPNQKALLPWVISYGGNFVPGGGDDVSSATLRFGGN